ncbi:hypothetical protein CO046_01730 [Candidatus Peregrinibacteria bacterium CG_4_9_14_0_2_um_filter_53_11]|nr:MAG: hypothetical protein CO046_01730 [Candidatus Peregrinibacteria bacterium CG_4_9_14_0_2_um_filter_53_11]
MYSPTHGQLERFLTPITMGKSGPYTGSAFADRLAKRLERSLDSVQGYVLITDPQGKILYANRSLRHTAGLTLNTLWDVSPSDLWSRVGVSGSQRMWKKIAEGQRPLVTGAAMAPSRLRHIHIAPVFDHEGDLEYYLELDPHFSSLEEEQVFETEFEQIMADSRSGPPVIMPAIFSWLSQDNPSLNALLSDIHRVAAQYDDFTPVLEHLLFAYGRLARHEDQRLVEAAHSDGHYFAVLYDKYRHRIFNYLLYRLSRSEAIAEELTQETFVHAFISVKNVELRDCTYLSYLMTIAHNLLVNYYRKKKELPLDEAPERQPQTAITEPGRDLDEELLWASVRTVLTPSEYRSMKLRYGSDLALRQIALTLDKSENAIKLSLRRARAKLAKVGKLYELVLSFGTINAFFGGIAFA